MCPAFQRDINISDNRISLFSLFYVTPHCFNRHILRHAILYLSNFKLDFVDNCSKDGLMKQDCRFEVLMPSLIRYDHLHTHELVPAQTSLLRWRIDILLDNVNEGH